MIGQLSRFHPGKVGRSSGRTTEELISRANTNDIYISKPSKGDREEEEDYVIDVFTSDEYNHRSNLLETVSITKETISSSVQWERERQGSQRLIPGGKRVHYHWL